MKHSFVASSKYLNFIAMLYVTISVASATIAYKFVHIGFFTVSGATVIFPLNFFISNVVADIYGYTVMKKIVWGALACEVIFALLIQFVIGFENIPQFHFQTEYKDVLGSTLKFVVSGILADLVGIFSNIYLFSKLKIYTKGNFFVIRTLGSTFLGEFFMLAVFMLVGFNDVPEAEKIKIFFSMYALHLIYDLLLVGPTWIAALFLKKAENLDVYDNNVNFNPFKIGT